MRYDNLGRQHYASVPYQESGAPGSYRTPNWSTVAGFHAYQYDVLGRPTSTTWRNGNSTLWYEAVYSYNGWQTTTTDANGHKSPR